MTFKDNKIPPMFLVKSIEVLKTKSLLAVHFLALFHEL